MGIIERFQRGWNAFVNNRDPTASNRYYGPGYYYRPDRPRFSRGNERSIVSAIFNRMALDVAAIDIRHVNTDKEGRYESDVDSGLNSCFTLEANIDQTPRAFIQDVVMSMFNEDNGCVAIVPIDTTVDPENTGSYDVDTMRTGKIVEWYPRHVKLNVYNDRTGKREDIYMPKSAVAIVENPFRAVMNEPNSMLQRLIKKLNILDAIDEQSASGKLDLIIQLPYVIKSAARRQQAEQRRRDIEEQLSGSKHGIAYTDGTERITQLNRPVENNLMKQIEYLTNMVYSQLNIDQSVLNGTADDKTMTNYNNRTIEPIISAIVDEMKRTFLTKNARTRGQTIMYFTDPFRLISPSMLPDMADKLTRNEIMTSNEVRQKIGLKPSKDPSADELRNKNLNEKNPSENVQEPVIENEEEENQNG